MSRQNSHEIRFGLIKATITHNSPHGQTRHRVKIIRLYKDGDVWKESGLFGRDDLPLVAKVADLAHTWVYEQSQRNGTGTEQIARDDDHENEDE